MGEADDIPLDLISSVHLLASSCTSSGSTEVRAHASVHRGFAGCCSRWSAFAFFFDFPSFLRRENRPAILSLSQARKYRVLRVPVAMRHSNPDSKLLRREEWKKGTMPRQIRGGVTIDRGQIQEASRNRSATENKKSGIDGCSTWSIASTIGEGCSASRRDLVVGSTLGYLFSMN